MIMVLYMCSSPEVYVFHVQAVQCVLKMLAVTCKLCSLLDLLLDFVLLFLIWLHLLFQTLVVIDQHRIPVLMQPTAIRTG